MSAPIAVIDTGICNLRSVTKALEAVGASPVVVRTPEELSDSGADGLVLPGVGALRDCVLSLRTSGLDAKVREWIRMDRPFLGVCLGMQALFEQSEEGGVMGLGIVPGRVLQFDLAAVVRQDQFHAFDQIRPEGPSFGNRFLGHPIAPLSDELRFAAVLSFHPWSDPS